MQEKCQIPQKAKIQIKSKAGPEKNAGLRWAVFITQKAFTKEDFNKIVNGNYLFSA